MPASVDKENHYKTIAKTCYYANVLYLVIHIFYLILFIVARLDILIYVDAAVIAIYLLFFLLLKKKKYYLYALCCGNEFFVFISVTTIMLGFNTGFHFYLIGLCVVSFFTSYFSKNRDIKGSLVWVGLSLLIYLTLYLVTQYNAPYYAIDKWLEMTLFILHAITVFVFVAAYLTVFLRYAFSLESKITSQSRTDELTRIGNRYSLYDYFNKAEDKNSLSLALFDIDDFKVINDTYGHIVGDEILKRVAEIAITSLSDSFVCRFGGEEFVAVLNSASEEQSFDKLENFRKMIEEETFEYKEAKIKITVTIGVVKYPGDSSLEKWVDLADEKMYAGKNSGKNRVVM